MGQAEASRPLDIARDKPQAVPRRPVPRLGHGDSRLQHIPSAQTDALSMTPSHTKLSARAIDRLNSHKRRRLADRSSVND